MSFSSFFSNCLNHLSVDAQNHAADLRMMFRQLKSLLAGSGPRRRSLRSLRAAAWLSISPAEALEQRINLASFALTGSSGSGTATITLASNESLTVLANTSTSYTFTLGSGSWTGTAANGFSASGTTLTANSTAQTFYSTFTIGKASATTGTSVTFANSGTTNTFKDAFNVNLTGTGAAGAITFNGTTSFASSSGLTISTNRNIVFSSGSSLLTVNGGISLGANPTTAAGAVYDGVSLSDATVKSTGTGNITLSGRGGAATNTAEANRGINIVANSLIQTNSGNITLTGNGGRYDGTGDDCIAGINIDTSDIRSSSGNISLTGNGSSTGGATVGDCDGINLEVASNIVTGSTGSVSLIGTAKRGGEGVDIEDSPNNTVVSGSGGLVINGSATSSNGMQLGGSGNTYMLLNALSGPIQITATSETGDSINASNFQLGDGTVTNLTLTATGGSVTAGGDDDGLDLLNVSGIITGTLTINSTAGDTGETEITSSSLQAASISITATTAKSGALNINASTLNSTGNMTISGSCTTGTGGTSDNNGIYVYGSSSLTATNTLSLTGTAKDDGEGIDVVSSTFSAATLQITGTAVNSNAFDIASATFNATHLTVIANTANAAAIDSDTGTYVVSGNATFTSACSGGTGDNDGAWFGGGTITVGGMLSINATAAAGGEGLQLEAGLVATAASISLTVAASTTASEVIVINGGSSLTSTGASGITATATGSAGSGVRLNAASLLRATNGPITLSTNRPIVLSTGDLKSDGTGSITLTTDTVTLSGVGAEINAGTGTVTILTKTANYPIQLGAVDSASALALESSELALITAGSLIIGSTTNTQPITLAASTSPALAGNLTLRAAGGVQPAAVADDLTLASAKTVSFGSNTPLKITIAGNVPDSGYDRLNVTSKVDLTNTSLSLTGAYTPVAGDVFTIVSAPGGLSGTFNSLADGSTVTFNGRSLLVNYSATTVTLTDPAPVVTTAPSSLTITYGNTASFTAAASGTPDPTVQWQQNNGSGWTNISGGTGTTLSLSPTVAQSGYLYRAIFTNTYGNATSAAATLTVNQASTTTSLTSSADPVTFGSSVTFTATVTSGASGTVTFKNGTTILGTGTITAGTATFATASLNAGSHSITAVYEGDANYASSTSSALAQIVNQASTTTSLTSSADPVTFGSSVTFTATVTSGASGTVTFKNGTTTLGTGTITAGTATFATTSLNAGSHSITAVYEGDANYASSTSSALNQTINQASTTTSLTSSADPVTFGSSVTFTATVTSGASGTVTFKNGTTTLGTGTITAGTATFATTSLNAGSHSITAVYEGDANYASSTSSALNQTINQASTTTSVASSANPGVFGSSVTFTATVTSGASGTVTFMDGTTTLGTGTITAGTATFATASLSVGSHSITAVYDGDSNYASSTSSALTQTINQASNQASTTSLASSVNPGVFGSSVTFTATVTSGASGTVTFKDGTTTLGTGTITAGTATFATTSLNAGSHSITAVYEGDANYASSTSSALTQTINQASTTTSVASSANPGVFGSSVTFTATVTSGASGTVTFKNGTTTLGTGTITAGTATFATASLNAGSHSITAVYDGDANYASSTSSALTQTVNKASTTTTVTPSWNPSTIGLAVTLTASVTPGATGNVTFRDGATTIGTGTISSGTATLSTTSLTIGVHSITAVYDGDSNYASSTSSAFTQVVTAAPVITGNPVSQAAVIGGTCTFTASATGFPNPTVQWQISTNGGTTWAGISGATSTTYTTPALVAGNDGAVYRAVFTNSSGVAVTTTALLHVNQTPTVTTNPADTTVSPGTTARFTTAARGWPVPTVQWQKNSGSGWNNIPGETDLAYTTPALTVADSATQFRAVFTNSYGTASSSPATLTVASVAAVSNVAVGWGSQTANLSEASGGRLLPAGRNKTIPWLGIQQIALTFDQPVPTLSVADIRLASAGGFTYGITSVTGSGTSWTINLSSGGLVNADRVTVSVGSSSVASWNRRLDVLPGDVNDDAAVTSVDQMLVSRQVAFTYIKFYDIDGNGLLTAIDFSLIKARIGKKLP